LFACEHRELNPILCEFAEIRVVTDRIQNKPTERQLKCGGSKSTSAAKAPGSFTANEKASMAVLPVKSIGAPAGRIELELVIQKWIEAAIETARAVPIRKGRFVFAGRARR
jgi:hypothetical protein